MDTFFTLLAEFGLPIASSAVMGVFIYIILKYILGSVIGQVGSLHAIITQLDNRIRTMNHDMIKLDLLISHALELKPDEERIPEQTARKMLGEINGYCYNRRTVWISNIGGHCHGIFYFLCLQFYHKRNET